MSVNYGTRAGEWTGFLDSKGVPQRQGRGLSGYNVVTVIDGVMIKANGEEVVTTHLKMKLKDRPGRGSNGARNNGEVEIERAIQKREQRTAKRAAIRVKNAR